MDGRRRITAAEESVLLRVKEATGVVGRRVMICVDVGVFCVESEGVCLFCALWTFGSDATLDVRGVARSWWACARTRQLEKKVK